MPTEKKLRFRPASSGERRLIYGSITSWFGREAALRLRELGRPYALDAVWVEVFAVPREQEEVLPLILGPLNLHPYSLGLYLGRIGREGYLPSLPLAFEIARYAERGIVVARSDAGNLFLYGRDLFRESLLEVLKPCRDGQLVLVVNGEGEPLGYGVYREEGLVAVENLLDLGWYLRRGG